MKTENRIVMTLDAGGTNLVFSAIRNNEEIVTPVHLRSEVNDLDACLRVLLQGFSQVKEALTEEPVAISFAFPGPADYGSRDYWRFTQFPFFPGWCSFRSVLAGAFRNSCIYQQ